MRAKYLFKTITSYGDAEREDACNEIAYAKSWCSWRYVEGNRENYIKERLFVEELMYGEFSARYWKLKESHPVYFYIYPGLSTADIKRSLYEREDLYGPNTKLLFVDLKELSDERNITFTVLDSFQSYAKVFKEKGFNVYMKKETVLREIHGKIYHINEIDNIYSRKREHEEMKFEIQIWDKAILENIADKMMHT